MKVSPDGRFLPAHRSGPHAATRSSTWSSRGSLYLSDEEDRRAAEVPAQRRVSDARRLLGDSEWDNAEEVLERVLPERSFVELSLDHPVYHGVFEITSKGQVPNIRTGIESEYTGVTWEENHDGDTRSAPPRHFRRQGPHDGHRHPQHRQRRRLGTRGRRRTTSSATSPRNAPIRSASTSSVYVMTH
jgi:hypothetical protein